MNENPDPNARGGNVLNLLGSQAPQNAPRPSFYHQIGGAPAVRAAVDRLYQLILTDPELLPYFKGKDLPQLKSHMAALLTKVLGGPDGYAGRDLAAAHQGLGITEAHFYKVADFLINVLLNMGVNNNIVAAVSLTLAGVKEQIVQQPAAVGEAVPEQEGVAAMGEAATPGADSCATNPSAPVDEITRRVPGEEDGIASSVIEPTPGTTKGV